MKKKTFCIAALCAAATVLSSGGVLAAEAAVGVSAELTADAETSAASEAAGTDDGAQALAGDIAGSADAATTPEIDASVDILSNFIAGKTAIGETWAAGFIDLTQMEGRYLNSSVMQAASLIKLYIMGAVYERYDSLAYTYGGETIDSLLYSMITVSDNDAANTLTNYLGSGDDAAGRNVVNTYCTENGYNDSFMGRMLLAPTDNGDNFTSVKDCCKFLLKLYNGEVGYADEMMALLKNQQRTHKIPQGIPAGVETANKTGELADVENDAAVIFAEKPYIFVVMSEYLGDAGAAQYEIGTLSSQIYQTLNP